MAYKKPVKAKLKKGPATRRVPEYNNITYKAVDIRDIKEIGDDTEKKGIEAAYKSLTNAKDFAVIPPPMPQQVIMETNPYQRSFIIRYDGAIREIQPGSFLKYSTAIPKGIYYGVTINWYDSPTGGYTEQELNLESVKSGMIQLPPGGGLREKFFLYFSVSVGNIKVKRFQASKHISALTGKTNSGEGIDETFDINEVTQVPYSAITTRG